MTEARLEKAPLMYDDSDRVHTGLRGKPKTFLLKTLYRDYIKFEIRYPDLSEAATSNEKYQETFSYLTVKRSNDYYTFFKIHFLKDSLVFFRIF